MASQGLSGQAGDRERNSRLIKARFNAGFSQRALAEASGLSRTAIAELEAGARPKPSNAKAIADALGCKPLDIFTLDLDPPEPPDVGERRGRGTTATGSDDARAAA